MGVEWILDVFYCHLKTIYLLLMDTGLISIMRYKQDLTQRGQFIVTADALGELITGNSNSTVSVGGSETRPRNIAFNYIVRAA